MRNWFSNIYYSFPVQLLVLHLRSHLILIIIWLFLASFVTGQIGGHLGFSNLFLDPEYLGKVGFWSFFIIGMTYALFFMSWNLSAYLLTAHHFPFLATLARPFSKFCINNALIPLFFFLFYIAETTYFQLIFGRVDTSTAIVNNLGLISGTLLTLLFYALYFQFTNRDIHFYKKRSQHAPNLTRGLAPGRRNVDIDYIKQAPHTRKVKTYLNDFLKPKLVRSVAHYESSLLKQIFKQNHLNALIFQLLTMFILVFLGLFIDYPIFRIPAGASVLIMLSILIALIGAVTYWFSEWNVTVFILLLICINYFTSFDIFNRENHVVGIDYEMPPTDYSLDKLREVCFSDQIDKDIESTKQILENWKKRNEGPNGEKPKMTIICVSGGGLKAAIWAMKSVQMADSLSGGQVLKRNVLMTGASGGMLGIAYLRELYLRKLQGEDINIYERQYLDNISKDLLNSITFTWVTNDFFLPFAKFKEGDYTYFKDRGYMFEKQLNENTDYFMQKTLLDYKSPEAEGLIPMLYITPSIINDARRMIISPHGVSFMMLAPVGLKFHGSVEIDAVDFGWLLEGHHPENLSFISALRMNATFPYVLPNAHLPTTPKIEIMDAGFRDNYGILSATRFIQVYKDWILENTSGVVLLQISSSEKLEPILPDGNPGSIQKLLKPLGFTGLMFSIQEFEQDNNLGFVLDLLGEDMFEIIRFTYTPQDEDAPETPVSFHITALDKKRMLDAINSEGNQAAFRRVEEILGE